MSQIGVSKLKKPKNDNKTTDKPTVHIEGLVLLKVIKHCEEYLEQSQAVTGSLLGLRTRDVIEITQCFSIPSTDVKATQNFQKEMLGLMESCREDNYTMGWYRSAVNGRYLSEYTIQSQYKYQQTSPSAICLVYDPTASKNGRLLIRAFRLTNKFVKFYKTNEFGPTMISNFNLNSDDIFEELSIKIHNSHLVHAFLFELRNVKELKCQFDRLHHNYQDPLINNLKQLSNSIDSYASETQHFKNYYRSCKNVQTRKQEYLERLHSENRDRKSRGLGQRQIPDDLHRIFPQDPEPNRLESTTLTAQMESYTKEISTNVIQGLSKLFMTQSFQSNSFDDD